MKILIDKYIPFLKGVLEAYAQVQFLSPEEFTHERVMDADALIIRTRTRCDQHLLEGTSVRFIATATIGYDHIDTDYCHQHHIFWTSCPGCNAQAVCDYVAEAIRQNIPISSGKSVGVIGVGHVGSKVVEMARRQGFFVRKYDPPKGWVENVSECDIITYHVPLSFEGDCPTFHMCDEKFLSSLRNPNALIINASRGGVVDETALLQSHHPFVIDCWENEPDIHQEVLQSPNLRQGSFHIAGYSILGKRNASQMCLDALCHYFQLPALSLSDEVLVPGDSMPGWLNRVTTQLKTHPSEFEQLRKAYLLR